MLPSIETPLPRAKPLPKPKAPTKWEQFAAAKGIQKKRREKKIWDEEKQEWVDRWGRGAKNKQVEEQWAVEVPANARAFFQVFSSGTLIHLGARSKAIEWILSDADADTLGVLYSERLRPLQGGP